VISFFLTLLFAADPLAFEKSIGKQPAYRTETPQYGLLAFGPEGKGRVWVVLDGDTLYVDRNGNGDLTDPGEKVAAKPPVRPRDDSDPYQFEVNDLTVGGRVHKALYVLASPLATYKDSGFGKTDRFKTALARNPKAMVFTVTCDVDVPGMKGGGTGGRLHFMAGPIDLNGLLEFGTKPADAPVIHLGGPLQLTFYADLPTARVGRGSEWALVVGTPGVGPGTFAMLGYDGTIPKGVKAVAEVTYQPAKAGDPPLKVRTELNDRCCTVNLYDTVRVPTEAGTGSATIALSLPGWEAGKVAPTTHSLVVEAAKLGPVPESVTSSLVATLAHPDRKASVWTVKFSDDGKRLFSAGYPSGVVQIWDVAERKELRRIDSPRGYRGSAEYALLTPDWKTLFVPVETHKVTRGEKDGKPFVRVDVNGEVRVWDATTGTEKPPLKPPAGSAPIHAMLSPDGKWLVAVEEASRDTGDRSSNMVTAVWDVATGGRRKLCDGYAYGVFSRDGKTVALATSSPDKGSTLTLFDTTTGEERAKIAADKERRFSPGDFSPDGSVLAVALGGKKGAAGEMWFRDAKTLADRGKFVGEADPERYGLGAGRFTPDGTRYVVLDDTRLHVWDVAAKKRVRTIAAVENAWHLTLSPDGKTAAVAWMPKGDNERARDPDPSDLAQPRVTLLDLAGTAAPRTLVCPHGFVGGLAFSPDGKTLAFGTAGGVHLLDVGK
jgi:WD40 repeat protein